MGSRRASSRLARLAFTLLCVPPLVVGLVARVEADDSPLWGFADLHTHQFANLGFGGAFFHGEPFNAGGPPADEMARALPPCDFNHFRNFLITPLGLPVPPLPFSIDGQPVHGPLSSLDLLGNILDERPHTNGGFPTFDGWPRYTTHDHQQMYHEWLKRAWQGGLRLMVVHALNNETFCMISSRRIEYNCFDMPAVDRQLQAAKDCEAWIDQLNGGAGKGWYRIAYSGAEARQIIAQGKLAVVLGIEVDDLFGCLLRGGCSEEFVRSELERYYSLGVRHLFPIHLSDNLFGGSAVTDDKFNINTLLLTGHPQYVRDCSADGFQFKLGTLSEIAAALLSLFNANPLHLLLHGFTAYPTYPQSFAHCNRDGLTALGESLIRHMIDLGMIIDIDHMSELSVQRTLEICGETGYPVVGGHTGFLDTLVSEEVRHEGQKTTAILEKIRKSGGLFGVGLITGTPDTLASNPRIAHTCGKSSQSWAIEYLYAASKMLGGAVGVGSDFNGFAGAPVPRFGGPGDGNCQGQVGGVSYPFRLHVEQGVGPLMNRSVVGQKMFDYNTDGFAHIGLYPDFVEDMKSQGLTADDLAPFFRSAEAYVRLWERIESRSYCRPVDPIAFAGVVSTGYDEETGSTTGNGLADQHFTVAGPPGLGQLSARVVPDDAFPIGPWLASSASSKWIGLSTAASVGPPGTYTFSATVEVPAGVNPALVRLEGSIAADDQVADVRINGIGTRFSTTSGYASFTPLPPGFGKGLFHAGSNTVDVLVVNSPPNQNPVGLRVEAALRSDELMDLAFVPGSGSQWPISLPAGEVLTISDTVINDGTASGTAFSPEVSYSFRHVAHGAAPLLLGTRTCPSLAPGESSSGTLAVLVPPGLPSGIYALSASVGARAPSVERNAADNLTGLGQILVLPQATLGYLHDVFAEFPLMNWTGGECLRRSRRFLRLGITLDRECWAWAKNPVFPSRMTIEFDATFYAPGDVPEVGRHGGVAFCGTTPTERTDPSFSGYDIDWIDRIDDRGLRLVRVDAGVLTTVAVGNPWGAENPPTRWRIEVLPDRIRVFGDGDLFIDHVDTTYRGGSIGFWAWANGQDLGISNVNMENVPLTAAFSAAPLLPTPGAPITLDGGSSVAPLGVGIAAWSWTLGDGAGAGGPTVSHAYTAPGDFPVTLTVTDGLGRTASATQNVHVYEPLAPFTDCFDFEEGSPGSWYAPSGAWRVEQQRLTVATEPTRNNEAWAWAGASPRPIAGDFVAELDLTADFVGFPQERGAAPPFAGLAIFASRPAESFAEGPTGYLIGWMVPRVGQDPILCLSLLRGNARMLAISDALTFADQADIYRWRLEVTADAIALTVKGRDILRVHDRRFRSGFVGLYARNGGSLSVDDVAIAPRAPPCLLTLSAELPAVDPPMLRLRGSGVPPAQSCAPRSDCACDEVRIAIDGRDVGVFPAGNPFAIDLRLPANCVAGTRRSVVARSVSAGEVGPPATISFTCPASQVEGRQLPGDCNGDGSVDIADALCLLFYLFVGDRRLPCDDPALPVGSHTEGSRRVIDFNGDASVSITDPIALLEYLFRSGPPPALGANCTIIPSCPQGKSCR